MAELRACLAKDGARHIINFLSEVPESDLTPALSDSHHAPEIVAFENTEIYVWTPNGVKEMSLLYSYLEKKLGVTVTARNWNTLEKVIAEL